MKFLFDLQDKYIAPLFEKGGKFERLYPLFEAGDTFNRTPGDVTKSAPHVRDSIDQKRLMVYVVYALFPCILFGIWNAGNQFNISNGIESSLTADLLRGSLMVLPIIFTSYLVGGICEVTFAIIRKHEINEGFLVSGMLFPLTLAPTTPLWQVALGIAFGIIIGKEIFGGVGDNILNPALPGRAFVFLAYPAQISGDRVWVGSLKDTPFSNKLLGITEPSAGWESLDGVTMATPLAISAATDGGKNAVTALNDAGFDLTNMIMGNISGSIGSTSVIAILIGLGFLLLTGVASNKIILSGIFGALFMGCLLYTSDAADE